MAAVQGQQFLLLSAISASFLWCREIGIEGIALAFLSAPDVPTWLCAEVLIFWCVPSFSGSLTLQFLQAFNLRESQQFPQQDLTQPGLLIEYHLPHSPSPSLSPIPCSFTL